jgi:hypothetical protein
MQPIYLEVGKQRVFACAVDWPGWCRSGKNEALALEALAAAAPRYARVAAEAGFPLESDAVEVVARVPGSASTDFGAPGAIPDLDREPLTPAQAERLVALVAAAWRELDRVVGVAPPELRKGPRGGGRDRDAIFEHVLGAEEAYARKLGLRVPKPALGDVASIAQARETILSALQSPTALPTETSWPVRSAARRIAWHALDHAWEIQDRQPAD